MITQPDLLYAGLSGEPPQLLMYAVTLICWPVIFGRVLIGLLFRVHERVSQWWAR